MKIWTTMLDNAAASEKETAVKNDRAVECLDAAKAAAFENMVEQYHRDVCHLVYRMTQNRAEAQR